MESITFKDYKKILICLTLYLTSLFAANTLGLKTMPFLFGTHISVSILFFPIVFIMTDVIGEVYGKKMAKLFVMTGILSILLFLIYSLFSAVAPWSDKSLWVKDSYNQIFGISVRMSIASLLAYAIAEYQDVISFFFFKKKMGEKHFWVRSNLSNIWSQFLDTAIFMFVAFLGVYSISSIWLMIIPWWIFKTIMGLFYTPLSYLAISLLRGHNENTSI